MVHDLMTADEQLCVLLTMEARKGGACTEGSKTDTYRLLEAWKNQNFPENGTRRPQWTCLGAVKGKISTAALAWVMDQCPHDTTAWGLLPVEALERVSGHFPKASPTMGVWLASHLLTAMSPEQSRADDTRRRCLNLWKRASSLAGRRQHTAQQLVDMTASRTQLWPVATEAITGDFSTGDLYARWTRSLQTRWSKSHDLPVDPNTGVSVHTLFRLRKTMVGLLRDCNDLLGSISAKRPKVEHTAGWRSLDPNVDGWMKRWQRFLNGAVMQNIPLSTVLDWNAHDVLQRLYLEHLDADLLFCGAVAAGRGLRDPLVLVPSPDCLKDMIKTGMSQRSEHVLRALEFAAARSPLTPDVLARKTLDGLGGHLLDMAYEHPVKTLPVGRAMLNWLGGRAPWAQNMDAVWNKSTRSAWVACPGDFLPRTLEAERLRYGQKSFVDFLKAWPTPPPAVVGIVLVGAVVCEAPWDMWRGTVSVAHEALDKYSLKRMMQEARYSGGDEALVLAQQRWTAEVMRWSMLHQLSQQTSKPEKQRRRM